MSDVAHGPLRAWSSGDPEPRPPGTRHPRLDPAPSTAALLVRCDCCGTERRPGDPILCLVCGEPALVDEWTP